MGSTFACPQLFLIGGWYESHHLICEDTYKSQSTTVWAARHLYGSVPNPTDPKSNLIYPRNTSTTHSFVLLLLIAVDYWTFFLVQKTICTYVCILAWLKTPFQSSLLFSPATSFKIWNFNQPTMQQPCNVMWCNLSV